MIIDMEVVPICNSYVHSFNYSKCFSILIEDLRGRKRKINLFFLSFFFFTLWDLKVSHLTVWIWHMPDFLLFWHNSREILKRLLTASAWNMKKFLMLDAHSIRWGLLFCFLENKAKNDRVKSQFKSWTSALGSFIEDHPNADSLISIYMMESGKKFAFNLSSQIEIN